jgi:hypothetical protein
MEKRPFKITRKTMIKISVIAVKIGKKQHSMVCRLDQSTQNEAFCSFWLPDLRK